MRSSHVHWLAAALGVAAFVVPAAALAQNTRRSGTITRIDTAGLRPVPLGGALRGWSLDLPGGRPLATPAVDGGIVFIGGGFGSHEFYAVDAATGRVRWAVRASDDGPTGAVVQDGYVVFNTESCTLFVVRASTGEMVWSRWLGDPLMSQPAVDHGRVFMAYPGAGGHKLAAFDLATGRPLWERAITGDLVSAPIVAGDSVYGTTVGGQVVRLAVADGRPIFTREQRATSAPWVEGERVYVSMHDETASDRDRVVEGQGYLRGTTGERGNAPGRTWGRRTAEYLDERVQATSGYRSSRAGSDSSVGFGGGAPSTAGIGHARSNLGRGTVSEVWEYQGSRPVVSGRTTYSTMGDEIRAIDNQTGAQRWSRRIDGDLRREGGHLATPPAMAGGRLVAATTSGKLMVVRPATGEVARSWELGQPIRSQVAVVGGRIFVGTTGGKLVMIESGDASLDGWPMWGGGAGHLARVTTTDVAPAPAAPHATATPPSSPLRSVEVIPLRQGSAGLAIKIVGAAVPFAAFATWAVVRRRRSGRPNEDR